MTVALPRLDRTAISRVRAWAPWLGPVAALAVLAVLQLVFAGDDPFPAAWDTLIEDPMDTGGAWLRSNRLTHPVFEFGFTPVSNGIDGIITGVESLLLWLPWFVVLGAVFLVLARVRRWVDGAVAVSVLAYTGLIGLWSETMETLALMSTSVLLAVIIGIPLGVWGALRPRVEQFSRPILDAMQTIPAFLYFLPLFMLFGIGNVPAAVATVIYALPPVVRLTTLGIKEVPDAAVEASTMFGSSRRQTLFKVQLPMALPTILTGLSQTIMMALGIVVLATLIGAGGLGSPVLQSLNQRRTGRGIAAGLAIVAVAMVLDRLWRSLAERDPTTRLPARSTQLVLMGLLFATAVGRLVGIANFPDVWDWTVFDPLDTAVAWARDNLRWLTRPISDGLVGRVYVPTRDFLTDTVAWPVLVAGTAYAALRIKGIGLAAFTAGSLLVIGLTGMWELSIDTLVQVVMATVLAVLIAVPIGIWAGRRPRVESTLGPILDALQTIPSLVYIIPAVILFTVGMVPGLIATVLYALVPGVRLTALGIRQVPKESVEAARTFGATNRQAMYGVRLPLAASTIMAGINQVIMMVLAMVIVTGLVGGGALGFETVRALQRSLFGLGFEVGLSLVLMAMILDRFTQAASDRLRPPSGH